MSKIKVIIKHPDDKVGRIVYVNNTLERLQMIVKGYIEIVDPQVQGIRIICNEEGKLSDLPRNFRMGMTFPDIIMGTVIVCGVDGEDLTDVPIDIGTWKTILRCWGNEVD
jgi:hypothetical protein